MVYGNTFDDNILADISIYWVIIGLKKRKAKRKELQGQLCACHKGLSSSLNEAWNSLNKRFF